MKNRVRMVGRQWCASRERFLTIFVVLVASTLETCKAVSCKPGCHDIWGYCEQDGECLCQPGWTGELCQECDLFPGCQHGTCHQPWQCNCEEGWTGRFCEKELDPCDKKHPCQNNGTCLDREDGGYVCLCPRGYNGVDCEVRVTDCSAYACLNGGSCILTPAGFRCLCPYGYTGSRCESTFEIKECEEGPCENGGTCDDTSDGFKCRCMPGFTGPRCESLVNECLSNPCRNGGHCLDSINAFICRCPPGFVGDRCEVDVDDCLTRPCLNGATCSDMINDFSCTCSQGYTGKHCHINIDDCANQPCQNGGSCQDGVNEFVCTCASGYGGDLCESADSVLTPKPIQTGRTVVKAQNTTEKMLLVHIYEKEKTVEVSQRALKVVKLISYCVLGLTIPCVGFMVVILVRRGRNGSIQRRADDVNNLNRDIEARMLVEEPQSPENRPQPAKEINVTRDSLLI
ncbi:delta-like protein 1 isoform X1 [Branchiostoma floridae]|uniref:Delta-like protein 1 isoform X1 n=2 Tax=Branchiostoma floridae TaxID=7739 RepID=A0A9J7MX05_BRAFL|nr:delta-like protein 1 isoform X1 [Branchiostoma floridae]